MWILPNNHPLYSAFAQEYVASSEDLKEYFQHSESPLMWRSKPLSLKTFCQQWKRVWWMQHLFGRILKHSIRNLFEERLTELLVDIHASHSASLENKVEETTQGIYGRISVNAFVQLNLFGDGSKTLLITSISGFTRSGKSWKDWVIQLSKEYTLRRKSALLTLENDCSSSRWTTPASRDYKDTPGMVAQRQDGRSRNDQLPRQIFSQAHEDYLNDRGRNPGRCFMNPGWTIQLMGTTLGKIFTVPLAIQLLNKPQSLPLETCVANME